MLPSLLLSLLPVVGPAQGPAYGKDGEPWRLTHYGEEAGLEEAWTWDVVFEEDSTAWIATTGGLARFDGYDWRWLRVEDGLPSAFVRCLCWAEDGSLWVGTDHGVVRVVDGRVVDPGLPGPLAGPSVRHVMVDSRGRTWFSCDRWPKVDVSSGLSCLEDGVLTHYGLEQGLPDEHVLGSYESAEGEFFALTLRGLAQLEGERFRQPLVEQGLEHANVRCWSLVESHEGLVVVADDGEFLRQDGRWTWTPRGPTQLSHERVRAEDGTLFAVARNETHLFVRLDHQGSWPVGPHPERRLGLVTGLELAPDGSLWVVGSGGLLRWERGPTTWEWQANGDLLPGSDPEGWAWVRTPFGLERIVDGDRVRLEQAGRQVWVGPDGWRLLETRDGALARWHPNGTPTGRLERLPRQPDELAMVRGVALQKQGRFWAWGGPEALWFAHFDPESGWTAAHPSELTRPGDLDEALACRYSGLVIKTGVSSEVGAGLRTLSETGEWREWALPEGLGASGLLGMLEDSRHEVWLYGFGGAYHAHCDGGPWERHEGLGAEHASQLVDLGEGRVLGVVSGAVGDSGHVFLLEPDGSGRRIGGGADRRFLSRLASGEICLGGVGTLHCVDPLLGTQRLIGLPLPLRPEGVTECGPDLLVEQERTVLRFRGGTHPPRVQVGPTLSEVPAGEPWVLPVTARARFLRGAPHDSFLVRMTLDGEPGPWREIEGAGLPVPPLTAGEHDLLVEVLDAEGVSAVDPARVRFRALDPPLQERLWFRVLAGSVGVALLLTTWASLRSRRRISHALDVQQGEYRALFESAQVCHLVVDPDGRVLHANASARRLLGSCEGLLAERLLGRPWEELRRPTEPGDRLIDLELAGQRHELSLSVSPRGAKLPGHQLALLDVSERRRIERALLERGSQLELAVAGSGGGLWSAHWPAGPEGLPDRLEVAPIILRQMGHDPTRVTLTADWWVEQVHRDDRARMQASAARILRGESDSYAIEYRVRTTDGRWRWLSSWGVLRSTGDAGSTLIGVHWDVTERRLEEEQRELLVAELNHRVKNTLATVLAIVGQTAQRSSDLPSFEDAFRGRIAALARVHETLARRGWEGAPLGELVNRCLAPFRGSAGQRRSFSGPDVTVGVQAASTLAMALHELATNASKYGSLSVPTGELEVHWDTEVRGGTPWVVLEWHESGGPLVREPERRSFGTTLVERGCAYELGGEVALRFQPDGVRCTLAFPLAGPVVDPIGEVAVHVPRPTLSGGGFPQARG